jgi:1,4-dihydroxy-2-naphthoate octaprenyltransferase
MNWFKIWFKNARSIALPQSLMPAITALVLGLGIDGFNFIAAVIAVVGVVFAHLGMNLADDYFDYIQVPQESRDKLVRMGIRARTSKCPYLKDGSATVKQLRNAMIIFLLIAAVCGVVVTLFNFSTQLLWVVGITLILGIFYSAPPLKLSYRGLGELIIGIIFGPLLMVGISLAGCGHIDPTIAMISVPVGLLVINILFTHSFLDMEADKAAGKMTLARLLKSNTANLIAVIVFNMAPFAIVVYGALTGWFHWAYAFVLTALPAAVWLTNSLFKYAAGKEIDSKNPPAFLGKFPNWEATCQAGLDWFMIRWLTCRNLVSRFCMVTALVTIILKVISLF